MKMITIIEGFMGNNLEINSKETIEKRIKMITGQMLNDESDSLKGLLKEYRTGLRNLKKFEAKVEQLFPLNYCGFNLKYVGLNYNEEDKPLTIALKTLYKKFTKEPISKQIDMMNRVINCYSENKKIQINNLFYLPKNREIFFDSFPEDCCAGGDELHQRIYYSKNKIMKPTLELFDDFIQEPYSLLSKLPSCFKS